MYSVNVPNLILAGKNISVSHIALSGDLCNNGTSSRKCSSTLFS
ncbi:hypothetical protein [Wenyingzhuangia heitensis]